jgi:hypothetical protein
MDKSHYLRRTGDPGGQPRHQRRPNHERAAHKPPFEDPHHFEDYYFSKDGLYFEYPLAKIAHFRTSHTSKERRTLRKTGAQFGVTANGVRRESPAENRLPVNATHLFGSPRVISPKHQPGRAITKNVAKKGSFVEPRKRGPLHHRADGSGSSARVATTATARSG